jgi:hypothetical protein
MNKIQFSLFFLCIYSSPALSRYTDHLQGDSYSQGDGVLVVILAALFLASTAYDYVKKSFKKTKTDGVLALFVISSIAVAIFFFPIIGSILLIGVIIQFVWVIVTS